MAPALQRAFSAPCPGCGALVVFHHAQSTHAICAYCLSTVVSDGGTLSRLGKMAEVFDDYSPLQISAIGHCRHPLTGKACGFAVIGRLQYKSSTGTWSEWQLALDDSTTAVLSEDNGAFVFSVGIQIQREIPVPEHFRPGATTALNGLSYVVSARDAVSLIAAQGELPKLPPLGQAFGMVELRDAQGQVLSIDYGTQPATAFLGRSVRLEDLQLVGLRDSAGKQVQARQFSCPQCGGPITVSLSASLSITCGNCHSIVDISKGVGGELRHALQDEPVQPLIPLGRQGQLQGASWQVVGFQHRMGVEPGDDEHFGWSEYLLYNKMRGFCFLVDSEDGWSIVKPTTGAPEVSGMGRGATYLGKRYELKSTYNAETTYVAGEFYWPVTRGQKTSNRDYAHGKDLLSMEQTPTELTWSGGSTLDSLVVAKAFKLDEKSALFSRADAAPATAITAKGCLTVVLICFLIIVLLVLLGRCSRCDPNVEDCRSHASGGSARSSGGSFGGFSGGGGHK